MIISPFISLLSIPRAMASLQSLRTPTAMASSKSAPPKVLPREAEAAGANRPSCSPRRLLPLPILRREALLISILPLNWSALALPSHARERRARKTIAPEEYSTSREFPFFPNPNSSSLLPYSSSSSSMFHQSLCVYFW